MSPPQGWKVGLWDDLEAPRLRRSHCVPAAIRSSTFHALTGTEDRWYAHPWICYQAWCLRLYNALDELDAAYPDTRGGTVHPSQYA